MAILNGLETIGRYLIGLPSAGMPMQAYWVINDECNLRCQFCNFWKGIYCKENKKILSTNEIKSLISKISRLRIPYLLFTGGEPFLREDMLDILECAVFAMQHVRVQTNGTLITEKVADKVTKIQLDEIWLSVDGIESTHDYIRGGMPSFGKIVQALDKINYFKARYNSVFPYIVVHTVVTKFNMHQLDKVLDFCVKYNVGEWYLSYVTDITKEKIAITEKTLESSDVASFQMSSHKTLTTENHRLSRQFLEHVSFVKKKTGMAIFIDPLLKNGEVLRPRKRCILLWSSIMISPYGEVLTCPMLDKYILGDLTKQSLADIWNNRKIKKIRSLSSKKALSICEECCCQRRTLFDQIKDPANFKRVFIPKKARKHFYGHSI